MGTSEPDIRGRLTGMMVEAAEMAEAQDGLLHDGLARREREGRPG